MTIPRPCALFSVVTLSMASAALAYATVCVGGTHRRPPEPTETKPAGRDESDLCSDAPGVARVVDLIGRPVAWPSSERWIPVDSIVLDICRAAAGHATPRVVAPCATIRGLVVDRHGSPVAGASISVDVTFDYRHESGIHRLAVLGNWSDQTDAGGAFHMPRVPIGDGTSLVVSHPGFASKRIDDLAADPTCRRIRLERQRADRQTPRRRAPLTSTSRSHDRRRRWILTPCPREAIRIAALDAHDVQQPIWTATSSRPDWSRLLSESCGFAFPVATRTLEFRSETRVVGRIIFEP